MLGSLKKTALLIAGYLVMSSNLALKCQIVLASPIQAEPLVEQDGLVQSSPKSSLGQTVQELDKAIMHVYHAKDGSYWFGSDSQGAYRYDKKSFVRYSTEDGLAGNRVVGIQEDRSGVIYFTTNKGISKFDGKTFTTLQAAKHLGVFPNAWKLEPDDLWFPGHQDTGEVFRFDGKTLSRHLLPPTKIGQEVAAKFPRDKFPNAIWNPNDVGVQMKHYPILDGTKQVRLFSMHQDRDGQLWLGTHEAGAYKFDGQQFVRFQPAL